MNWKHDDLAYDLAEHLARNSDRMIWTDMQLGPSGSPRPDVYTINKRYSTFCPVAYECKISVSDFRSDVTRGKWQSYLKFASGVIFAAPKGLISKDDVPKTCGLIVRNETGWRTIKGPTMTPVKELPRDAWLKLLIDGTQRSLRDHYVRYYNERKVRAEIAKKYGDELAEILHNHSIAKERLEDKIKHIQQRTGELDVFNGLERMQKEIEDFKALKTEICEFLELPNNVPVYTIRRRMLEKQRMLDADYAVAEMKRTLSRSVDQLEQSLKDIQNITAPVFKAQQGGAA